MINQPCLDQSRHQLTTVTSVNHVTIFRLFCLFNRFCDLEGTRMRLSGKSLAFVVQKLGLNPPETEMSMNLKEVRAVIFGSVL